MRWSSSTKANSSTWFDSIVHIRVRSKIGEHHHAGSESLESAGNRENELGLFTTQLSAEIAERKALIDSLEQEIKALKERILHLETEMKRKLASSEPVSPTSCCSSTPSLDSSSSSIEDKKQSRSWINHQEEKNIEEVQ